MLPEAVQDVVDQMFQDHDIDVPPNFSGSQMSVDHESYTSDDESDVEGLSDLSKNIQRLPG